MPIKHLDWSNAKKKKSDGAWEEYWKAGYEVAGCAPVLVETYCRSQEQAIEKAKEAATAAAVHLDAALVAAEVVPWTQPWRVKTPRHEELLPLVNENPIPRRVSIETEGGYILPRIKGIV